MAPISLDDTIINQTNVNIARCQRLIASWLPPPSAHDLQHSKTEAEVEEEDKRTFIPEPEVLGLGQAPPEDGAFQTRNASNDAKLRRQMLGRDYDRKRKRTDVERKTGDAIASKSRPTPRQKEYLEEESEEEAGRSALGKSKSSLPEGNGKVTNHATAADDTVGERMEQVSLGVSKSSKPVNGNFLDHLLAEKERKRRKRKNKRKARVAAEQPVQL